MAERILPGSLKCVIGWSPERPLREALETALRAHVSPGDIRSLGEHALLVHTEASTADIRDRLMPVLSERESLFVLAFERWSARGAEIDREWLRARGH